MNMEARLPKAEFGSAHGAAVTFAGVTKAYGPHVALQPTSLDIGRGEFFAIIGPSGSGKSTMLGIVAGFVPPSGGTVLVDGADILSMPPYKRDFGMVFQGYALFPHMTVAENIAFPLKMRGFAREDVVSGVKRALAMVRLEEFSGRYPSQLSGGQQQRVALARAAVYNPPLLLMDEPLGALDKNLREEMQEEIRTLQRKLGATVIYVTHDQHEAAFMADRLAVMQAGQVEQVGTPREIYEQPSNRFIASFLGEASILPVQSVLGSEGGLTRVRTADGLDMLVPAASSPKAATTLCLRPENIFVGEEAKRLDNVFQATITEAVFTTGTVRYRLRVGTDTVLTVRVASHPGISVIAPGSTVPVGWSSASVCVLRD